MIGRFSTYLLKELGKSENTMNAYANDVKVFFEELGKDPADVTEADVRRWKISCYGRYSPTTINRKIVALNRFYNYLCRYEGFNNNPFEDVERVDTPGRLPRVLSKEEIEAILDAPSEDSPYEIRDKAIIHTIYVAGLRISELINLNVDHLLPDGLLRVIGKGDEERIVPIVFRNSLNLIRRYIDQVRPKLLQKKQDEPAMFVSTWRRRMSENTVRNILRNYAESVGITGVHPHILRHSIATYLHDQGVDIRYIQEFLGHKNLSTTQIYTRVSRQSLTRQLLKAVGADQNAEGR